MNVYCSLGRQIKVGVGENQKLVVNVHTIAQKLNYCGFGKTRCTNQLSLRGAGGSYGLYTRE